MLALCIAAAITVVCYLMDSWFFKKRAWHSYAAMFFIVAGINFAFPSKAEARVSTESVITLDAYFEKIAFASCPYEERTLIQEYIYFTGKVSDKDKKKFMAKAADHKEKGLVAYGQAKEKCWWLPNMSDADKAKLCFSIGAQMAIAGDPYSKITIAVVQLLIQYGINAMTEWSEINSKMQEAKYHFEMHEFYIETCKG